MKAFSQDTLIGLIMDLRRTKPLPPPPEYKGDVESYEEGRQFGLSQMMATIRAEVELEETE